MIALTLLRNSYSGFISWFKTMPKLQLDKARRFQKTSLAKQFEHVSAFWGKEGGFSQQKHNTIGNFCMSFPKQEKNQCFKNICETHLHHISEPGAFIFHMLFEEVSLKPTRLPCLFFFLFKGKVHLHLHKLTSIQEKTICFYFLYKGLLRD